MRTASIVAAAVLFLLTGTLKAQFSHLVVSLTGSVFDEKTHQPIEINIKAYDEDGKMIYRGKSNSIDGYYFITGLKPGSSYSIFFEDFDYFRQEYTVDIPNTDKYQEFSKDFLAKPKEEGVKLPFIVSPFELHKSKVRHGADIFLKNTIMTVKRNRSMKFKIQCFPDNNSDKSENLKLTQERCQNLKNYFIENGVPAGRITGLIPEKATDPENPPPFKKRAKGKRYIGTTYIIVDGL